MIGKTCSVLGCTHPYRAKGYCLQHYHSLIFLKERPLYRIWQHIISRCENPKDISYRNYGKVGITVCERWRHDYRAFEKDVGPQPSLYHSIDRIDLKGNYEPHNVQWATPSQQAFNKRAGHRNKSGVVGVYFHKRAKMWTATINLKKKTYYLGYYKDKDDAIKARAGAEATFGYEAIQ